MAHLTEAQYKVIEERILEEHKKYANRLASGEWASVAARKVVSQMVDFRKGGRVFTESEVRAVFIALSQRPGVSWKSLLKIANEHGIVLDPA